MVLRRTNEDMRLYMCLSNAFASWHNVWTYETNRYIFPILVCIHFDRGGLVYQVEILFTLNFRADAFIRDIARNSIAQIECSKIITCQYKLYILIELRSDGNRCLHIVKCSQIDKGRYMLNYVSFERLKTKQNANKRIRNYELQQLNVWKLCSSNLFIKLCVWNRDAVARQEGANHTASWCVINTKQFSFPMLPQLPFPSEPYIWLALAHWGAFSSPLFA